jgi:hypothetical protein
MKRPSNGPFSLYGQSWGRLGNIGVNRARWAFSCHFSCHLRL